MTPEQRNSLTPEALANALAIDAAAARASVVSTHAAPVANTVAAVQSFADVQAPVATAAVKSDPVAPVSIAAQIRAANQLAMEDSIVTKHSALYFQIPAEGDPLQKFLNSPMTMGRTVTRPKGRRIELYDITLPGPDGRKANSYVSNANETYDGFKAEIGDRVRIAWKMFTKENTFVNDAGETITNMPGDVNAMPILVTSKIKLANYLTDIPEEVKAKMPTIIAEQAERKAERIAEYKKSQLLKRSGKATATTDEVTAIEGDLPF